jgi:hypothetical protein
MERGIGVAAESPFLAVPREMEAMDDAALEKEIEVAAGQVPAARGPRRKLEEAIDDVEWRDGEVLTAGSQHHRFARLGKARLPRVADRPSLTCLGPRRHGMATTEEFIALSVQISGQDLSNFFQVWLYTREKPKQW